MEVLLPQVFKQVVVEKVVMVLMVKVQELQDIFFQEAQVVEVEVALPTITTTQVEVEQVELLLPMQDQVEVVEPQDILNGATTQQMQVEQVAQEMVEVEVELTTPIIPTTLEVDIQETQEQVVH